MAVAKRNCDQGKKFAWICDACRRIRRPIWLDSRFPTTAVPASVAANQARAAHAGGTTTVGHQMSLEGSDDLFCGGLKAW